MRITLRKGLKLLQFITYKTFSSRYDHLIPLSSQLHIHKTSVSQLLGTLVSICVAGTIIQLNRITCSLRISQSSQLNAQVSKTRIMTEKLPITE